MARLRFWIALVGWQAGCAAGAIGSMDEDGDGGAAIVETRTGSATRP